LIHNPDYDFIKQSQIDWFVNASQAQRSAREKDDNDNRFYLSLAFLHIPLPEFGDPRLSIRNGHRREQTESPSFNFHFYDVLAKGGISALGCGHDHVNDFCALLPQGIQQDSDNPLNPVLGYVMEVAVGSGGIARSAKSDFTDGCGFGKSILIAGA
jgi:hypothetical protein